MASSGASARTRSAATWCEGSARAAPSPPSAHLDAFAEGLEPGQRVRRGAPLRFAGTPGNARTPPPRLHVGRYHVSWQGARAVDPVPPLRRLAGRGEVMSAGQGASGGGRRGCPDHPRPRLASARPQGEMAPLVRRPPIEAKGQRQHHARSSVLSEGTRAQTEERRCGEPVLRSQQPLEGSGRPIVGQTDSAPSRFSATRSCTPAALRPASPRSTGARPALPSSYGAPLCGASRLVGVRCALAPCLGLLSVRYDHVVFAGQSRARASVERTGWSRNGGGRWRSQVGWGKDSKLAVGRALRNSSRDHDAILGGGRLRGG
jgi:hypothetical protein